MEKQTDFLEEITVLSEVAEEGSPNITPSDFGSKWNKRMDELGAELLDKYGS